MPDPDRIAALRTALLSWGVGVRTDLPWRATRDPWAVLVSELMLQQTQVARVVPRYHAFLARFPTPTVCAAAPVAEVVRAWEGLGYNRRAVNLHRTATALVTEHAGALPDRIEPLLALPGVGPYTARAVLAFAFERDHGVLDTNAARFLARAVTGHRLTPRRAQTLADALVPAGQGWAWNQAVLDLGATVCISRRPRCGACPIADRCAWRCAGWPDPDPAVGSAGSSGRQPPFEGSDRQGRGRLVRALARGPVPDHELAVVMGWPEDPGRAARVAAAVVADGLAIERDGAFLLPDGRP